MGVQEVGEQVQTFGQPWSRIEIEPKLFKSWMALGLLSSMSKGPPKRPLERL